LTRKTVAGKTAREPEGTITIDPWGTQNRIELTIHYGLSDNSGAITIKINDE
jgi:hypothetical protein